MSNWPTKPIVVPAEDGGIDVYCGGAYVRMSREAAEKMRDALSMAIGAHPFSLEGVAEAYGWLWHIVTGDRRVHAAQELLRDMLTDMQRGSGINAARERGAYTSDSEVKLLHVELPKAEADRPKLSTNGGW